MAQLKIGSLVGGNIIYHEGNVTGAITSIISTNLTSDRALVANASGKIAVSNITSTELGYLSGVTSSIQTQLNGKAPTNHASTATTYGVADTSNYGHVKIGDGISVTTGTVSIDVGNGLQLSGTSPNKKVDVVYGATVAALGTASAGAANSASRSDHVHAIPSLADLTTVTITNVANNNILQYDGTKWVNRDIITAGISPAHNHPYLSDSASSQQIGYFTQTKLYGGSKYLGIVSAQNIATSDKTLTIDVNNVDRTLKINANVTLAHDTHASGSDNQNLFSQIGNTSGTSQFSAGSQTDMLRFADDAAALSVSFTSGTKEVKYSHSTANGYKHIPSGGASGQILEYNSAGTAQWKTAGSTSQFLRGDGTWQAPPVVSVAANAPLEVSSSGGTFTIKPKSAATAGYFDTGSTNPTATTRLNYGGYLYATKLYSGGSEVITTAGGTIGNNITIPDPTDPMHAATKQYVDAVKTGLDIKDSVRVATTTNLVGTYNNTTKTLTITATGVLSIDGVSLVKDDRVLIKDQTDKKQNGIYVVTTEGKVGIATVFTRSHDADNSPDGEVSGGMFTFVEDGTTNSDSGWVLTTNGSITFGTSDLTFVQFSGAGQIIAGTGISKSGNTLSIDNTVVTLNDTQTMTNKTITGTFTGNLSGNASTATKWATTRTLSLTGSVTGSANIDGSGNVSITTTTNHDHSLVDDILDGSTLKYSPYSTKGAGHLYTTDTTAPSNTTSTLNYDGIFRATQLLEGNTRVALQGHNHNLSGLTDVTVTTAVDKDILSWNGTKWINRTAAEAELMTTSHTANGITALGGVSQALGTASNGSGSAVALANHVHPTTGLMTTSHAANAITALGGTSQALAASASNGTSTAVSRADHVHPTTGLMTTSHAANSITGFGAVANIQDLGTKAAGTSTLVARADHVHAMPSIGGLTDVTIATAASGHFLRHDGTSWKNVALVAADIPNLDTSKLTSGTLGVARGGTGASSLTANYILKGNGTSAISISSIFDNGTSVGIGTASPAPANKLEVNGTTKSTAFASGEFKIEYNSTTKSLDFIFTGVA